MKVLVADDDEITRVTLRRLLTRRGYEVVLASNGIEALERLSVPDAPMIAILDWMMPKMDGVEACRRIRASARGAYTYVIILSSRDDKRDFRAGMEAGADDYVSKPFDTDELHLRLRAGERIVTLQEKLRAEARVDFVTNTLNRGAIMGVLRRAIARAARDKTWISVILADIDHFKLVNDTYGHPVGDAVLQHVAQAVQSTMRDYDAVGRYGGEEFVIVSPNCDGPQAYTLAERVRTRVEHNAFTSTEGEIAVTISLGVSAGFGEQLEAEDLIRLADNALYGAKKNGRNRTEVADTQPAVFELPASKNTR